MNIEYEKFAGTLVVKINGYNMFQCPVVHPTKSTADVWKDATIQAINNFYAGYQDESWGKALIIEADKHRRQ